MSWPPMLAAAGVAFLLAGALVPLLVRFAVGRNLLDVPNIRSSHEVPTPRLGGVAIAAGAWAGFLVSGSGEGMPLLAAATLVWAVGLADDFVNLHFRTKAAAQALVATALLILFPPQLLASAPGILKAIVFVVGVFWIVALCNAFNFMDGIDGITGGVAVINALFLIAITGATDSLLPALAGATLGFLIWNVSPASMFCGDSGSYFLGFGLAALALYTPVPGNGWSPVLFLAGVLVFTPYLFDTGYTLARRAWERKNVFSAHREHVYQRITPATTMHRRTSNLYYGASVVTGLAALLVAGGGVEILAGLMLVLVCCAGLAALPLVVRTEN
ncbi:MAG: hypothetical protein WA982_09630 [Rubrobacteraceae bacterium]